MLLLLLLLKRMTCLCASKQMSDNSNNAIKDIYIYTLLSCMMMFFRENSYTIVYTLEPHKDCKWFAFSRMQRLISL
jgi:hypothetical protein